MPPLKIEEIRSLCEKGAIIWSQHIAIRCRQCGIKTGDIENAIITGEIIEQYPTDYPYPSCLIFGLSISSRYLHVVCGVGNNSLWIISAYFPNLNKWESDFKTRKGK